jgi:hypothetical protein
MHKQLSISRNLKIFTLTILTVCILLLSSSVLADDTLLGDPPSFPNNNNISSKADSETQNEIQAAGNYFIYLSLIQRGQDSAFLNIQDRQVALDFYQQQYLTSQGVAMNWTGNQGSCNPGSTDLNFRLAVLRRINYFRAVAGVPAGVTFSDDSNRKAQAAALMMSVNNQLSHDPPNSWLCYSSDGHDGAGSSNLSLGAYAWDAIALYMKDPGTGNYFAGHRRWILYPQTQVMGTGDIPPAQGYPASNSLVIFDTAHMWEQRPLTRETYVAWPPPGYVPYQVVFSRWSFALANADFKDASVTMASGGSNLSVTLAKLETGYGENTLVWIQTGLNDGAAWPVPPQDTTYTISIHNVLVNSQSRDYQYNVIVFNPGP